MRLKANEFYCVSCHGKCTAKRGTSKRSKARVTGQPMLKARCSRCGNKVCKFVKR